MYTKEELEQMDDAQLLGIAKELGAEFSQDDARDTVVYAILDKAAEQSASGESPKRKRTRIKKETDRVYTVKGSEGENFDVKTRGKKKQQQQEAPSLFTDLPAETPVVADESATEPIPEPAAPAPKKRGRKSEAELAAIAAAEEAAKQAAETPATDEQPEEPVAAPADVPTEPDTQEAGQVAETTVDDVPEAQFATGADGDEDAAEPGLLEQLQAKMAMKSHEEAQPAETPDGVWEGDPGDGTDFIIVHDLPIEDQEAIPTLDIFDRPVVQPVQEQPVMVPKAPQAAAEKFNFQDIIGGNGVMEILQDGYGFVRSSDYNYLSSPDDIYVSPQQVKKWGLKTGDVVDCTVRPPHDNEKYFTLSTINTINGRNPAEVRDRVAFEHLTPLFPEEKFTLCGDPQTTNPSVRIVDLFSPIGKGQRALIVAQPKTGKTILMKDIANAIAANHPEAYIMMLLIDERPEEVTDMARTVDAEVIASTFDEPADRHVKIAGIVLEKAKRMVECGHDVVIFLDSITRLARAYNTVAPASGKVLTGGVDANALQKPKRFFGAARNIEGGGSLTIIATALVDTGSKMDEVIFEEFKGTGNSEIQLNRTLSNKRIFPAIDLVQSSTRRDDLLQDPTTLNRMWIARKFIAEMTPIEAMNTIRDRLVQSRNNEEFLLSMNG
jgi:transcription termination factor Rho